MPPFERVMDDFTFFSLFLSFFLSFAIKMFLRFLFCVSQSPFPNSLKAILPQMSKTSTMNLLNQITRSLSPPLTPLPLPQPTHAHFQEPLRLVNEPPNLPPPPTRSPFERSPPSLSEMARYPPKPPPAHLPTLAIQEPTLRPSPTISINFFTWAYKSIQELRALSYLPTTGLAKTSYIVSPEKLAASLAYARKEKLCVERGRRES